MTAQEVRERLALVDARCEAILEKYMWEVVAAALLGEDPPDSPLEEIRAIRERTVSEIFVDPRVTPDGR